MNAECDCGATPEVTQVELNKPGYGSVDGAVDVHCPGCGKTAKIFMGPRGRITVRLIDKHERKGRKTG